MSLLILSWTDYFCFFLLMGLFCFDSRQRLLLEQTCGDLLTEPQVHLGRCSTIQYIFPFPFYVHSNWNEVTLISVTFWRQIWRISLQTFGQWYFSMFLCWTCCFWGRAFGLVLRFHFYWWQIWFLLLYNKTALRVTQKLQYHKGPSQ